MTLEETKQRNRELCERFPFLIPFNRWSGKKITDCCGPDGEEGFWPDNPEAHPEEYDYETTELDDMPYGWRKAFGEQMCEEIMDELVAHDLVDKYRVDQIKEKYGTLRWYDSNSTDKIWSEIIPKYEELSWHTCIRCGKPSTKMSLGWVSPFCDECAEELSNRIMFKPIDKEDNLGNEADAETEDGAD